jgi:hypothetical protein
LSDWLATFICCNNAPDEVSAEALLEKNRPAATKDMAHQSCFITAIGFLTFDFLALAQQPAAFVPAQT